MDIEIEDRRENKLLDRTEVRFVVFHGGDPTPTRAEVRSALAETLDADEDQLILHRVRSEFGRGRSTGYAKLYDSKEDAIERERRYVLARNGLADEEVEA